MVHVSRLFPESSTIFEVIINTIGQGIDFIAHLAFLNFGFFQSSVVRAYVCLGTPRNSYVQVERTANIGLAQDKSVPGCHIIGKGTTQTIGQANWGPKLKGYSSWVKY